MAEPLDDPPTMEYLRYVGAVFKASRGTRSVTDIARAMQGRVSRATIDRLERGAPDVGLRSLIELAHYYGLSLSQLNRRALELVSQTPRDDVGGSVTLVLTRDERTAVLRALLELRAPTAVPPTVKAS